MFLFIFKRLTFIRKSWNTFTLLTTFTGHFLHGFYFDLLLAYNFELLADIVTYGAIQLAILLLKLQQLHHFLLKRLSRTTHSNFYKISSFQQHWTSTLVHLTTYNRTYGSIFTAFLLVNWPLSVYLTSLLILWRVEGDAAKTSNLEAVILIAYSVVLLLALFCVHYYFALVSKRVHASAASLHSAEVAINFKNFNIDKENNRFGKMNASSAKPFCNHFFHLKLAGLACAVNACNRYSITYGKMGKVSVRSFCNVSD